MPPLNITADRLTKYISLISLLTIISGLTTNCLYYDHFNISITDYIDLGESLLMFIPYAIRGYIIFFVFLL